MKSLLTSIFFIAFSYNLSAQTYEQNQIDSLLRIVNNPGVSGADRIEPLTALSRGYLLWQGDSARSEKYLTQARELAGKQKDSKYMIYVYSTELLNCLQTYRRDIPLMYQIIDSTHTAINRTGDLEAQALGYSRTGYAKSKIDVEYNYEDVYNALSIAEKLPDKSAKKQEILFLQYGSLYVMNEWKNTEGSKKYLQLMQEAAEKSGDKNYICDALTGKLNFTLAHFPNDANAISQNFTELADLISNNINSISLINYGRAIEFLIAANVQIPDARQKQIIDEYVKNFKKVAVSAENQKMLLRIESNYAYSQQNYAKAIELYRQQIELDEKEFQIAVWGDYQYIANAYKEMKQFDRAVEASEKSLEAYQKYVNIQTEEQRQVNEVKFCVAKQQQQIRQQKRRIYYTVITAISVIILLLAINLLLNRQRKINRLEKEKAELEAEQAKFMAEQALVEKEKLGKRLITNAAELARKDRLLDKMKDMDSKQLDKAIRREQKTAEVTKDYAKFFHEIRPEFYERLARQAAPNKLSTTDLKYCTYISMRMSNKDLAIAMNVEYSSVAAQKYQLKKKLHLTEEDSLEDLIVKFPPPSINII